MFGAGFGFVHFFFAAFFMSTIINRDGNCWVIDHVA